MVELSILYLAFTEPLSERYRFGFKDDSYLRQAASGSHNGVGKQREPDGPRTKMNLMNNYCPYFGLVPR